jgi:hypothetical protein
MFSDWQLNNLTEKFLSVLDALQKEHVDYVLIGGFAIVLHGATRFTEDIDIFVKTTEDNISRLRKALDSVFHDDSINEITLPEINNYDVIRYGTNDDFSIDIIGKLGEAFSYEDISYKEVSVEGKKVRLATIDSLYKLKEKTYRTVDQGDLLFLAEKMKTRDENNG